jgi:hypothetical protein
MIENKLYWIIKDGKPVKATLQQWLEWKIKVDNENIN